MSSFHDDSKRRYIVEFSTPADESSFCATKISKTEPTRDSSCFKNDRFCDILLIAHRQDVVPGRHVSKSSRIITVSNPSDSTDLCDILVFVSQLLGYARVSTVDQDASLQIDALDQAGCSRVFVDTMSGTIGQRPELDRLLDQVRDGDTIVVWRLDRLGRSLRHLITQVQDLADRGVGLRSLQESIDTTSPGGRLIFHVFGALAEFERDLITERTTAGLAAARARGRHGGRPTKLTDDQVRTARRLYKDSELTVAEIGHVLGVSRSTVYRSIQRTNQT